MMEADGPSGGGLVIYDQAIADLSALVLLKILQLRCGVFVVEQNCPYPDIDDLDGASTTRHLWLAPAGAPSKIASYLRLLREDQGQRIGRVVTAAAHRGRGHGARLIAHTLTAYRADTVIDAQSHLREFYERLGFGVTGPEFVEDGIPHLPMRREA